MIVCRYCDLESPVSHASERECIDALQREVTRLKDQLLRGQPGDIAAWQPGSEPTTGRTIERDGRRV
jgi:hypothetical protein